MRILSRGNPFKGQAIRWLVCLSAVCLFAWNVALCYIPGKGFTYFIGFGERGSEKYLPELAALKPYEVRDSDGYDGKVYAQLALRPSLGDPALRRTIDGLGYRARRMLPPWIAWAVGGGDPARILQVYAFQNVIYWLVLALVLFRWFPPKSWNDVLRWCAVLFSFGLVFSVRSALPDALSLLLIAVAMCLVESRRPWTASLALGVSGLARETNILALAGLEFPDSRTATGWLTWFAKAALVAAPLTCWCVVLSLRIGHGDDLGASNFGLPFDAFVRGVARDGAALGAGTWSGASVPTYDLLVRLGLLTQFLFFLFRPRWRDKWWRLGACYAALMVVLGANVWEGYPTAASRVLLPMTLAFNVLVPRSRGWIAILLLGNLGVIGSADISEPPRVEAFRVLGPRNLTTDPKTGATLEAIYNPGDWWGPEGSRFGYWRWSKGNSRVTLRNPLGHPVTSDLVFKIESTVSCTITVTLDAKREWSGPLRPFSSERVVLADSELKAGDHILEFTTDSPPRKAGVNDDRRLGFRLIDPAIHVKPDPGTR